MVKKGKKKTIPEAQLKDAIETLRCKMENANGCDNLLEIMNSTIKTLLETHYPTTESCAQTHTGGWFDQNLKKLKQNTRQLEWKWRKHPSSKTEGNYKQSMKTYHIAIYKAKQKYWSSKIAASGNKTKELFKGIAPSPNQQPPTQELVDKIAECFSDKVQLIRQSSKDKLKNPVPPRKSDTLKSWFLALWKKCLHCLKSWYQQIRPLTLFQHGSWRTMQL